MKYLLIFNFFFSIVLSAFCQDSVNKYFYETKDLSCVAISDKHLLCFMKNYGERPADSLYYLNRKVNLEHQGDVINGIVVKHINNSNFIIATNEKLKNILKIQKADLNKLGNLQIALNKSSYKSQYTINSLNSYKLSKLRKDKVFKLPLSFSDKEQRKPVYVLDSKGTIIGFPYYYYSIILPRVFTEKDINLIEDSLKLNPWNEIKKDTIPTIYYSIFSHNKLERTVLFKTDNQKKVLLNIDRKSFKDYHENTIFVYKDLEVRYREYKGHTFELLKSGKTYKKLNVNGNLSFSDDKRFFFINPTASSNIKGAFLFDLLAYKVIKKFPVKADDKFSARWSPFFQKFILYKNYKPTSLLSIKGTISPLNKEELNLSSFESNGLYSVFITEYRSKRRDNLPLKDLLDKYITIRILSEDKYTFLEGTKGCSNPFFISGNELACISPYGLKIINTSDFKYLFRPREQKSFKLIVSDSPFSQSENLGDYQNKYFLDPQKRNVIKLPELQRLGPVTFRLRLPYKGVKVNDNNLVVENFSDLQLVTVDVYSEKEHMFEFTIALFHE